MTKKHTLFFNPKTIILHKLDLFLNAKCGNICVNFVCARVWDNFEKIRTFNLGLDCTNLNLISIYTCLIKNVDNEFSFWNNLHQVHS